MDLTYETRDRAPKQLQLDSEDQRITLTFPLTPSWQVFMSVGCLFGLTAMQFAVSAYEIWMFRQLPPYWRSAILPAFFWQFFGWPICSSILGIAGWRMLRSYRRYGHLPRTLWIDAANQTLSYRPERKGRTRQWPLSAVQKIRVTKIKHLTGKIVGEFLAISLRGRILPLTFRCPVKDQAVFHSFLTAFTSLAPGAKIQWPGGNPN